MKGIENLISANNNNSLTNKNLDFYNDWVAKDLWLPVQSALLMDYINPDLCEKRETDIYFLIRAYPHDVPIRNIPVHIKKLVTESVVNIFKVMMGHHVTDPHNFENIKLNDGNVYCSGHPYVVIRDAYAKEIIDGNHPLLILVNARYKRQTKENLIEPKTNIPKQVHSALLKSLYNIIGSIIKVTIPHLPSSNDKPNQTTLINMLQSSEYKELQGVQQRTLEKHIAAANKILELEMNNEK